MKEDSDPIKPSSIQFEPEVHIESVEERGAMPFAETRYGRYLFQRESIVRNAPKASGVYGLFSAFWIYIGEADDLQARILEHLDGDDPCIVRFQPSGFAFELASPRDRPSRQKQLVKELQPLCDTSHTEKMD